MHIQAKSKKDAKQLAAAALLEVMLDHVPFQDLLYKSEKQQSFKEIQVWGSSLPVSAVASAVSPRDPALMCMLHIQCKVPWEVCSISWHVRILRGCPAIIYGMFAQHWGTEPICLSATHTGLLPVV